MENERGASGGIRMRVRVWAVENWGWGSKGEEKRRVSCELMGSKLIMALRLWSGRRGLE